MGASNFPDWCRIYDGNVCFFRAWAPHALSCTRGRRCRLLTLLRWFPRFNQFSPSPILFCNTRPRILVLQPRRQARKIHWSGKRNLLWHNQTRWSGHVSRYKYNYECSGRVRLFRLSNHSSVSLFTPKFRFTVTWRKSGSAIHVTRQLHTDCLRSVTHQYLYNKTLRSKVTYNIHPNH
jgi:hypothetical protein